MNVAEKQLVEALRSGKYRQTTYALHQNDAYCCLGVACDISNLDEWYEQLDEDGNSQFVYDGSSPLFLPGIVSKWLHWKSNRGLTFIPCKSGTGYYSLDTLNDSDFTFDQISDIISANLVQHISDDPWSLPRIGFLLWEEE